MPQFMVSYYINHKAPKKIQTPQEQQEGKEAFNTWIASLDEAVINAGTPLSTSVTMDEKGLKHSNDMVLTGFSIIQAASQDEAINMCSDCPFLKVGDVVISEIIH
jgi:CMP-2-keto-3-deoxyoctulosonic acid synthetase